MDPQAARAQQSGDLVGVPACRFADRDDRDLLPGEPEREVPGVVLDQPADEALEAAEQHPVDHDRAPALPRLVDVLDVEALGQLQVDLDRRSLPLAADRVADLDIDLRRVERPTALVHPVLDLPALQCLSERRFGRIPLRVGAEAFRRAGGEIDDRIAIPEDREELEDEVVDLRDLRLGLIRRAEDVRVVLGEPADPEHPVKRSAALVAVDRAELADPQRQLAIASGPGLEHLDVPRAVHRLDPEVLIEHQRAVHVLAVLLEMPGALVDPFVGDVRGVDEGIALRVMHRPPPGLELLTHDGEIGEPEHQAGAELVIDLEELEILPQTPVVAALDLLQPGEVRVELGLGRPDRPVDALQLGVVLVAPPVGAGDGHELERSNVAGPFDMRSTAEVGEGVMGVDPDLPALDRLVELLDLVDLVVLVLCAEVRESVRHA